VVSNSKTSRANAANPLVVRCTGMPWALGPIGRRAASSWYEFLPCGEGLYESPPRGCPGSQSEGSTQGSTQQYANRLHAFPMLAYCLFFFGVEGQNNCCCCYLLPVRACLTTGVSQEFRNNFSKQNSF
jgi:hypothetical protein